MAVVKIAEGSEVAEHAVVLAGPSAGLRPPGAPRVSLQDIQFMRVLVQVSCFLCVDVKSKALNSSINQLRGMMGVDHVGNSIR